MVDPHNVRIPDYTVVASVVPGTINILNLTLHPREGNRAIVVSEYPYLPNQDPKLFLLFVMSNAEAAANAAAGFLKPGHHIGMDGEQITGIADAIVRAVHKHLKSCIAGPDGKVQVRIDERRAIAGDIKELLGSDNGGDTLKLSPPPPPPSPPEEEPVRRIQLDI